jgi:methionine synthase I (cobalamin-dependent)
MRTELGIELKRLRDTMAAMTNLNWLTQKVHILDGGCCGTTPDFIKALKGKLQ